jgi:hypothetical protein
LEAELLLLHRRGVGLGAEVLDVELVLGEHDVEGDDAEQYGGDARTGEDDKAAGALAASPGRDIAGRDDLKVRPLPRCGRGIGTGRVSGTRGRQSCRHQAAS